MLELLSQRAACRCILDQNFIRLELVGEIKRSLTQLRVFVAAAGKVKKIEFLSAQEPRRTYRPVILRAGLGGGIPALNHLRVIGAPGQIVVIAEPIALDHRAAGRDRALLVLRREHVRSDLMLSAYKTGDRFSLRVQSLPGPTVVKFAVRYRDLF